MLAVLLLIARPITVLACVLPDRGGGWERNEIAFLCWTRETGVIPAALVGVLAGLGVPHIDVLASVVALAVVLTLLLQALPAPWLAREAGAARAAHEGGADGAGRPAGRLVSPPPDFVSSCDIKSGRRAIRKAAGSGRPPTG